MVSFHAGRPHFVRLARGPRAWPEGVGRVAWPERVRRVACAGWRALNPGTRVACKQLARLSLFSAALPTCRAALRLAAELARARQRGDRQACTS